MTKGQQGYMAAVKKKNMTYGLIGLTAMVLLYFTGLMIVGSNGSGWTLIAVLIALPSAQFLARYLSLRQFKTVPDNVVQGLSNVEANRLLYEIALVIGKQTYYLEALVLEEDTLYVYTDNKDLKPKDLKDFFLQKGLVVKVKLFYQSALLADSLTNNPTDNGQLLADIRKALMENSL